MCCNIYEANLLVVFIMESVKSVILILLKLIKPEPARFYCFLFSGKGNTFVYFALIAAALFKSSGFLLPVLSAVFK